MPVIQHDAAALACSCQAAMGLSTGRLMIHFTQAYVHRAMLQHGTACHGSKGLCNVYLQC